MENFSPEVQFCRMSFCFDQSSVKFHTRFFLIYPSLAVVAGMSDESSLATEYFDRTESKPDATT